MLFHSKRKFGKYLSNVKGIPVTFFLPEELDVALDVMRSCEECNWIYKPSHGSGGFGVRAVGIEEIEEIKKKRDAGKKTTLAVLQRAVTSLLVDNPGRKFDLRVYVAVASWKPLVAFILPDSLVCNMDRVCPLARLFFLYIYITRLKNHSPHRYDLHIGRLRKVPKTSALQEQTRHKESTVLWRTKILRPSHIIVRYSREHTIGSSDYIYILQTKITQVLWKSPSMSGV